MTELADILPIFSSYASNANEVDGRSSCLVGFGFNGLKFLDRNFSSTDADLIFARVVPKGQRRISITEFEKALGLIAERRSCSQEICVRWRVQRVEDVMQKVADSAGPSLEGTKADAVRLHDDKQTYTGVHARGGPDSVPKGYGHVPGTSSLTLGRRDSKDRRSLSRTPSGAACPLPNLLASGPAVERKLSRNMAGREHEYPRGWGTLVAVQPWVVELLLDARARYPS
ncbi:ADP-ribosylation factor 1 [Durusdinium trenchii]|uniref:ADP-ribosylation factor 1 n=1 Tax=Durusdinium trenchii TaxID=1381693 RepID=A0ABP0ISM5_9DINO